MTTLPIGSSGGISADTSRLKSADNLKKAGQQFEAVFNRMMLKAMRAPKLADSLFESKALDTFRDMADDKVAQTMADHQPIGIGKAVTEFLAKTQSDLNASVPSSEAP